MLKYDPKLRYSAYECLHHNWIKNYEQKTAVPLSKHIINNMRKFKVKHIINIFRKIQN